MPVWTINEHLLGGSVRLTVGLVCAGLGALVLLVPRRAAIALPVIVLAWFALLLQPVFAGPHGFKRSSQGAVFQGIRGVDRDWIDEAVPKGADVPVLGAARRWRTGSSSTRTSSSTAPSDRSTTRNAHGRRHPRDAPPLRPPGLRAHRRRSARPADYLLTDGGVTPDGTLLALDETGERLAIARAAVLDDLGQGPLRGHLVRQARRLDAAALPRRLLSVTLNSGPELFTGPNRVVAEIAGRRVSVVVPTR